MPSKSLWNPEVDAVTQNVKSFYEKNPFPNYDGMDSRWSLIEKAERGVFAKLLDEQIPAGARILEAGCGTGQLSNFLGLSGGRTVFGTDICMNSLTLGQGFKEKNRIHNTSFFQMDLFRPAFKPESFDLVISNGVLHHTSNPLGGFQSILRLVKKNGYILIGLYNTYGRILNDLRGLLFRASGDRFQSLDPYLASKKVGTPKRQAWFMDQYKHPWESKHTLGETLQWFDQSGVEFINSIPKMKAFEPFTAEELLFQPQPRGTRPDRALVQLGMLLSGGKEGGFFTVIGRKKR